MKTKLKKLSVFFCWLMAINADTPRNRFIKSLAKQYVKLCADYGVEPNYSIEQILLFKDDYTFDQVFKGHYYFWPDSITMRDDSNIFLIKGIHLYQASNGLYIH